MFTTSGWDMLLLTVRTTDKIELRVGAVFVLALAWIAYKVLDGWDEDDSPKATA